MYLLCPDTQMDAIDNHLLCEAIVLKTLTLNCALEDNVIWRDDHQESNYCENLWRGYIQSTAASFHGEINNIFMFLEVSAAGGSPVRE